jgi:hypothetical protein
VRDPSPSTWGGYLSGARLDVTTLTLMVDAAELRRALAVHSRLAPSPQAAVVRGKHPIIIDLFRVSQGRVEAGRTDQHALSALAGGSFGAFYGAGMGGAIGSVQGALAGSTMGGYMGEWLGPVGSLLGAATGWIAGGAFGAMAGLTPGVSKGSLLGAAAAGRASHKLSDTIGTYDEILIGVPDVVVKGDGERRYFFVLGMYTNSAVARWGDRAFAFGYRKQEANIVNEPFQTFQMSVNGRTSLSAEFAPIPPQDWREINGQPEHEALFAMFKQPLLGLTERGRLARSRLDRSFADPAVRIAAPARAAVTLDAGFSAGLPGGTYSLPALSATHPWGVLHSRSVMSRVSYPSILNAGPMPRASRPVR